MSIVLKKRTPAKLIHIVSGLRILKYYTPNIDLIFPLVKPKT